MCALRDWHGETKFSLEEVKEKVLAGDKKETDVFKRLYGITDPYNKKWVNLCLDTSNNSPEELVDIALNAASLD